MAIGECGGDTRISAVKDKEQKGFLHDGNVSESNPDLKQQEVFSKPYKLL